MRIEDIDSPRVKPWASAQAMEDLYWLGLGWDEGPDVGGPHGPYVQTERQPFYDDLLARLIEEGWCYPCNCSRSDIQSAASAPHEGHEGPVYPGTCAGWRVGDPVPPAETCYWRFRMPDREVSFRDRICGERTLHLANDLGDFPITRKGGAAAYQLAVVADDHAMGVTEVVRGHDLIPSAFRQLALCEALGWSQPQQIHVPLVVGPDGRRLAKRHGDTRLSRLREAGIAPERVIGWAAHSAGLRETEAPIRAIELLEDFDWDRLVRDEVVTRESDWL